MVEYTRLLKHLMQGEDVKAVKDRLVALGYLHAATHDTFGDDTLEAVRSFQTASGLTADGVVGPLTWAALFDNAEPAGPEAPGGAPSGGAGASDDPQPVPAYTRTLRHLMQGEDVKAVKDRLVALGYLHAATHDTFGDDTLQAVRSFQAANGLEADGVVGPLTWRRCLTRRPNRSSRWIRPSSRRTSARRRRRPSPAQLGAVSETRQKLVLEALRHAYDPAVPASYPYSLYIRGGEPVQQRLYREHHYGQAHRGRGAPPAGVLQRREQGDDARSRGGKSGDDRRGLLRRGGRAHALYARRERRVRRHRQQPVRVGTQYGNRQTELRPGDWVGRDGHIGLYAGGGYVVEWMGQLYGCQLSRLADRQGYDFVGKRLRGRSGWTKYRRPKYY